jgi:deoxyribodipyrimidine photo-lyase
LKRFLYTKTRKEQFKFVSPLTDGAVEDKKDSRIQEYATGRNLVGGDYSSKLSPYLTSGVISGRMVCNEAKKIGKGGKLESGRDTGVGMWVQEVRFPSSTRNVVIVLILGIMARLLQSRHGNLAANINGPTLP